MEQWSGKRYGAPDNRGMLSDADIERLAVTVAKKLDMKPVEQEEAYKKAESDRDRKFKNEQARRKAEHDADERYHDKVVAELVNHVHEAIDEAVDSAAGAATSANRSADNAAAQATNAEQQAAAAQKQATAAKAAQAAAEAAKGQASAIAADAAQSAGIAQASASAAETKAALYDKVVAALPHATADGTVAQCQLSSDLPLQSVNVEGATSKNLFPMSNARSTGGVTMTVNDDGSVKLAGTTTASSIWSNTVKINTLVGDKSYTLSGGTATVYPVIRFVDSSNNSASILQVHPNNGAATTFTSPAAGTWDECWTWVDGQAVAVGSTVNTTVYPMLVEGTEAKPFTPCGKITNVEGAVEVVRRGKNLLPKFNGEKTSGGLTYKANDDGSISVSGTSNGFTDFYTSTASVKPNTKYHINEFNGMYCIIRELTADKQIIKSTFVPSVTITTSTNCAYLSFTPYYPAAGKVTNFTIYPQLELGDTATAYEPYTEQRFTLTIPEGEFMGKLPDGTADYIEVKGGVGTLVKMTDSYTINGSEAWALNNKTNAYELAEPFAYKRYKGKTLHNVILCDKLAIHSFEGDDDFSKAGDFSIGLYDPNWSFNRRYMQIKIYDFVSDITAFKNWLNANNPVIEFPLQTPTTVDLGPVDLPDGVYGTTNVYASNEQGLSQNVDVDYIQDGTLVINELRNAIVEGATV